MERTGAELSEWEGEFLGSVEERVETYGRAFGDPEKGASGQALSTLQSIKLKEIAAKAKGKTGSKAAIEDVVAVVLDDDAESDDGDEDAPDPAPPRSPLRRRGFGR